MSSSSEPWFQLPTPIERSAAAREVIVLGAGIAGCSSANNLAKRGWSVTLIDRHPAVATESSGNPAAMIKPQECLFDPVLQTYHQDRHAYLINFISRLKKQSNKIDVDLRGLWIKQKEKQQFIKDAGWINPRQFSAALIDHPLITLQLNQNVTSIAYSGNQWTIFNNHHPIASSPTLILCCAQSIRSFKQSKHLPVEALAGQISLLNHQALNTPLKYPLAGKHYIIPLPNGCYLTGATNRRSTDTEIRQNDHLQNLRGLERLMADYQLDTKHIMGGRCAVRMVSPDHLPIVGPAPDKNRYFEDYSDLHHGRKNQTYPPAKYYTGLYLLTALSTHGINSAPYLAHLLGDIITSKTATKQDSLMRLLHPGRFLIRTLKKSPNHR